MTVKRLEVIDVFNLQHTQVRGIMHAQIRKTTGAKKYFELIHKVFCMINKTFTLYTLCYVFLISAAIRYIALQDDDDSFVTKTFIWLKFHQV